MLTKNNNCKICGQIAGNPDNDLIFETIGKENPYRKHIIYENDAFVLIPSIGPLAKGHVLICPKFHISSFAAIPTDFYNAYMEIRSWALKLLKENFNRQILVFEHGMDDLCSSILCSVSHAHQHLIPADIDITEELIKDAPWIQISSDLQELKVSANKLEYIFYERIGQIPLFLSAKYISFPSQYMRMKIAKALNKTRYWNWRKYPNVKDLILTFSMCTGYI